MAVFIATPLLFASGEYGKKFNLAITSKTLAGASMSAVPMLITFSLFQRAFTRWVTVGALKG